MRLWLFSIRRKTLNISVVPCRSVFGDGLKFLGVHIWGQNTRRDNFLLLLFLSQQTVLNKERVTGRFSRTGSVDATAAAT